MEATSHHERSMPIHRPPDAAGALQVLWSHHEKLLVVDQSIAFCGGIDMAFGRWDRPAHELADPEAALSHTFPAARVSQPPQAALHRGLSFYNPRISERKVCGTRGSPPMLPVPMPGPCQVEHMEHPYADQPGLNRQAPTLLPSMLGAAHAAPT